MSVRSTHCLVAGCLLVAGLLQAVDPAHPRTLPPGGANAPEPSELATIPATFSEIPCGSGALRFPVSVSIDQVATSYQIPGPIYQGAGADGVWRGNSYLEAVGQLTGFSHETTDGLHRLLYTFHDGATFQATLKPITVGDHAAVELTEIWEKPGQRALWVFDAYAQWQPTSAYLTNRDGSHFQFRYLPCHYDQLDATVQGTKAAQDLTVAAGFTLLSANAPTQLTISGDSFEEWGDARMELWQRRQLANDPAGRHVQAPETKSDGTPNPSTATMIGQSSYEGHVTVEFPAAAMRTTVWLVHPVPQVRDAIPAAAQHLAATLEKGAVQ